MSDLFGDEPVQLPAPDMGLEEFRETFAKALHENWSALPMWELRAAAGAILNTPEFNHLRKLTATCTCGTAGLDYEGPQADCAVCGAVRGVAELQKVNAKLYSENQQLRATELRVRQLLPTESRPERGLPNDLAHDAGWYGAFELVAEALDAEAA